MIPASWPLSAIRCWFWFGDHSRATSSSEQLASKAPAGSHLIIFIGLWCPFQIRRGWSWAKLHKQMLLSIQLDARSVWFCQSKSTIADSWLKDLISFYCLFSLGSQTCTILSWPPLATKELSLFHLDASSMLLDFNTLMSSPLSFHILASPSEALVRTLSPVCYKKGLTRAWGVDLHSNLLKLCQCLNYWYCLAEVGPHSWIKTRGPEPSLLREA